MDVDDDDDDQEYLLPGDEIQFDGEVQSSALRLGPGIQSLDTGGPFAVKAGFLQRVNPTASYIESYDKRYIPSKGDNVVGRIVTKYAEHYRVAIGAATTATLSLLAFEGATRRNSPNLTTGRLVYARVTFASPDAEPEIECVHAKSGKAAGYGELVGGYVVSCSPFFARRLLEENEAKPGILHALGKKQLAFETAIGANGQVWISSESITTVITVARVIKEAELCSPKDYLELVDKAVL